MNELRLFQQIGADLFFARLNNSHSGNLSIRLNRMMVITRSGAMLHRLEYDDIVETAIDHDDCETARASRESGVHKAIYSATNAGAIVHAHPPAVTAISIIQDRIDPLDAEGRFFFPNGIPILRVGQAIASDEVAVKLPFLLKDFPIAIVKGHGTFAIGDSLDVALHWTSCLENIAQIAIYCKSLKADCR